MKRTARIDLPAVSTVAIAMLLVAACSKRGGDEVAAGTIFVMPPGPLREPTLTLIASKELQEQGVKLVARELAEAVPGAIGPVYEVRPHGTQLAGDLTFRIKTDPKKLPIGVSYGEARFGTHVNGKWEPLPTRYAGAGIIEGTSRHLSLFGLYVPCAAAGTGVDFPLSGCATFNPRVETSAVTTLNVRAGVVTVRIGVAPSTTVAQVDMTISGLTPGATYHLHRDNVTAQTMLTADATGAVRFQQDTTNSHLLILQAHHGSIELSAGSCPSIGTWNAGTKTCTLTADYPNPPIYISEAGLTLDCKDAVTGLRHLIGSSGMRQSIGVHVFALPSVTVRNCDVSNVDWGLMAGGAADLRVENVSVSVPANELPGTVGFDPSSDAYSYTNNTGTPASFQNISVDNFSFGITPQANDTTVRHASFRTTGFAAFVIPYGPGSRHLYEDITIDGTLSGPASPLPIFAGAFFVGANSDQVTIRRLTASNLDNYFAVITAWQGASNLVIEGANITGARTAIWLEGPNPATVTDSSLTGNLEGVRLLAGNTPVTGGGHRVFHNNIYGNSGLQVYSQETIELSDTRPASPTFGQGSYWGRACPAPLFVAGTDSNSVAVVDSHPFGSANSWTTGNLSGCPALTAPVLTSPVDGSLLATGSPAFLGTAPSGATVELMEGVLVRGSAQAFAMGAFVVTPSVPFPDGYHRVSVRARLNGATSPTSNNVGFTVETAAPGGPTITFPVGGLVVRDTTVAIAGTAEPQALVVVSEGSTPLGASVADTSGAFQLTVDLVPGPHTVTAVAKDAAGNASPPSLAISFSVAPVSTATPLVGTRGMLRITSVKDALDPFTPSAGETNTVEVQGTVQVHAPNGGGSGSSGNGNGYGSPSYVVQLERELVNGSTGQAVGSYAATALVQFPQGSGNLGTFNVQSTWPGGFAPPGAYVGRLRLRVIRDPRGPVPASPAPIPDCDPGRGPLGCMLDIAETLDTTSLLGRRLPDFGPVLRCGGPTFEPDGGLIVERLAGVRIFNWPSVTFGRFQVDSGVDLILSMSGPDRAASWGLALA